MFLLFDLIVAGLCVVGGVIFAIVYVIVQLCKKDKGTDDLKTGTRQERGRRYEIYISDKLRQGGFSDVRVTQSSGDFGADVLCKDKNGFTYAVQCKNYSSAVGVDAVQEAYTAKAYYQTLPFDICCWGVGSGKKGSYNYNPTARIQFEMCEDALIDEDYFDTVMKEAQEFCAYLCKTYGFGVDKISSHHESYLEGYGGNHGDPENWLKPFGHDMEWFRAEVQKLLDADKPQPPVPEEKTIEVGSIVTITGSVYYSGKNIPAWVKAKKWIVKSMKGDRVVIDKSTDGENSICSPVNIKDLALYEGFTPYLVKVTATALNIRKGAGTNYPVTGVIQDKGVYTIVEENGNWGELKSGAGWISLKYTIKR